MSVPATNIPNPDPSVIANERLAEALGVVNAKMDQGHKEIQGWIDKCQILLEEKIKGAEAATESLDRVVQTRLAGSETALNAAMAASEKVVAKIESNFGAVLNELKANIAKQIDTIKESIDDIKGRLDRGEGVSRGTSDSGAEQRSRQSLSHSGNQNFIAAAALGTAILSIIVTIVLAIIVMAREPPAPSVPPYRASLSSNHG